jgi:hypothetical protein
VSQKENISHSFVNPKRCGSPDPEILVKSTLSPEPKDHGRVPDRIQCEITREITNYQHVFDQIWKDPTKKKELIELLDFEGHTLFMIVSMVSTVELRLPLGGNNENTIDSQNDHSTDIVITKDEKIGHQILYDNWGEVKVNDDWFRSRIANEEKVERLTLCEIRDESCGDFFYFIYVKFTRLFKWLKPRAV